MAAHLSFTLQAFYASLLLFWTIWKATARFQSAYVADTTNNFTIKHYSGLCVSHRPSDGLFRLTSTTSCDTFVQLKTKALWHTKTGQCIVPQSNSKNAKLILTSSCHILNTRFEQTSAFSMRHLSTGYCVHPEGGSIAPHPNTNIVIYSGCDENRLQFQFFSGCSDEETGRTYSLGQQFSPAACLSCQCKSETGITCYQKGPESSKLFCTKCKMKSDDVKHACYTCYDTHTNKTYAFQQTWDTNNCTKCECSHFGVKCQFTGSRVLSYICNSSCNVLAFVRRHPCRKRYVAGYGTYYTNPKHLTTNNSCVSIAALRCKQCSDNASVAIQEHGNEWNITGTRITCHCFDGMTHCKRLPTTIYVFNKTVVIAEPPVCFNCSTAQLSSYIKAYGGACQDSINNVTRNNGESFEIFGFDCYCYYGAYFCKKTIFGPQKFQCLNCSLLQIQNKFERFRERGCYFQGQWIADQESSFIGFGLMPFCMNCRCINKEISCQHGGRFGKKVSTTLCKTNNTCNAAASRLVTDCQRDVEMNCYTSPPQDKQEPLFSVPWYANGCRYSCGSQPLHLSAKFIQMPWCQHLTYSSNCAVCPDKQRFLARYNQSVFSCKGEDKVLRKAYLCDGHENCKGGDDEMNCTSYFCKEDHEIIKWRILFWKKTAINKTTSLDCRLINPLWQGSIKRTCLLLSPKKPEWTKIDLCQCRYSTPDPIEMGSAHLTADEIVKKCDKIFKYSQKAIDIKRIMELGIFLVDKAIALDPLVEDGEIMFFISNKLKMVQVHQVGCMTQTAWEYKQRFEERLNVLDTKFGIPPHIPFTIASHGTELDLWTIMRFTFEDELYPEGYSIPNTIYVNSLNTTSEHSSIKGNLTNSKISTKVKKKVSIRKRGPKESSIHDKVLRVMDISFGMMSLVALSVAVVVMFFFDVPKTTKLFIHKNLFAAWFITYLVYIVGTLAQKLFKENEAVCSVFVFAQYYFSLARYSWMMIEGVHLFTVVVLVFQPRSKKHYIYGTIGWGTPLVPFLIGMAVQPGAFLNRTGCLALDTWMYKGPVAALLGANVILFVAILRMVIKSILKKIKTSPQRLRSSMKAFMMLVPLLGICQILGFAIQLDRIIVSYLYVIINGFLGVIITFLHCFLDPQVQEALKKSRARQIK